VQSRQLSNSASSPPLGELQQVATVKKTQLYFFGKRSVVLTKNDCWVFFIKKIQPKQNGESTTRFAEATSARTRRQRGKVVLFWSTMWVHFYCNILQ
jgi:hypothetical protein